MGTQSSLGDSSGVLSMLVLVVLTMSLALPGCLPASQSPVVEAMPKLQLAYLVEDGQYRQPGMARSIQSTHSNKKIEDGDRSEVKKTVCHRSDLDSQHRGRGRSGAGGTRAEHRCFEDGGKHKQQSKCILQLCHSSSFGCRRSRTLDKRSYGKRRRRSPQIEPQRKNAHHFGLKAPKVDQVKVKSHGSFGREVHAPVIVVKKDHTNFLNGAKERRKRRDNFIPFSVYDDRRRKTLKIEENDARALPLRLQIEKKEQLARQAKALALKNEKSSKTQ